MKRPARSQVLTALLVFVLAASVFMAAYVLPSGATGSGGGGPNIVANANNNGGSTTCYNLLSNIQQNDYVFVWVWVASGDKFKGTTDSASDSFTDLAYVNSTNFRLALWGGQYTGATGGDTVTVHFTSSGVNKCTAGAYNGLSTGTPDDTSSAVGSVASSSATGVLGSAMTTPSTDFCEQAIGVLDTGTVTAMTVAPTVPVENIGVALAGTASNGKHVQAQWRSDWPSNTGTFTFSTVVTETGATNIEWALLTSCWPTTQMTTTTTTTTTPTTVSTTTTAYSTSTTLSTTVTSTSWSPTTATTTTTTSTTPTTTTSTEVDTTTATTTATTTPTTTETTTRGTTTTLTTTSTTVSPTTQTVAVSVPTTLTTTVTEENFENTAAYGTSASCPAMADRPGGSLLPALLIGTAVAAIVVLLVATRDRKESNAQVAAKALGQRPRMKRVDVRRRKKEKK